MLEKELEQKCCNLARAKGWQVYKFVSPGQRGVPDRLFIKGSPKGTLVVFVEFKRKGNRPTPLQERKIAQLRDAGCRVLVIDDYLDFQIEFGLIEEGL